MADPLSISASIISILQLTSTVVEYLNRVKGFNKARSLLLSEVSSISGTLFLLKDLVERTSHGSASRSWSSTIQALNAPRGPLDQFQSTLERLVCKLVPVQGTRKFRDALIWPFKEEEIKNILDSLERQKSYLNLALENDHLGLSQEIEASVREITFGVKEIKPMVLDIHAEQTRKAQNQHVRDVLGWLSPHDFTAQHFDLLRKWQDGTGQWFLDSTEFLAWKTGNERILFCPGIPGAGKTMLASIVIDHLQTTMKNDRTITLYAFCSYQSHSFQTAYKLLSSLLAQLIRLRYSVPDHIDKLYLKKDPQSKDEAGNELEKITQAVAKEILDFDKVFIVIDALDEFLDTGGERDLFLRNLLSLRSNPAVQIMVTSRLLPKVENALKKATRIEIRASKPDVLRYLESQIFRLPACVSRSTSLRESVISTITDAVDGMFLLAKLHVDSLVDKVTPKAVKAAIAKLPRGGSALDLAYDKALMRIRDQLPGFRALAEETLAWLTYTQEPLTVMSMLHALAVEPLERFLDEDNLADIDEVVSACQGLVIIDRESNIVRFVHYTTKEYFEKVGNTVFSQAQATIATVCITYLSFDDFQVPLVTEDQMNDRDKGHALYLYAANYWGEHVKAAAADDACQKLALSFLMQDNSNLFSMVQAWTGFKDGDQYWNAGREKFSPYLHLPPLHIAAIFGLTKAVESLIANGADVNQRDRCRKNFPAPVSFRNKSGEPALCPALSKGHVDVVDCLIANGAEVEPYMLYWAISGGDVGNIQRLLATGLNARTNPWESDGLLHIASGRKSLAIAKCLLENGADVNGHDDYRHFDYPLLVAVNNDDVRMVKLLLENGANPDRDIGGDLHFPIFNALSRGYKDLARLLVDFGANVMLAGDDMYSCALSQACNDDDVDFFRFLLTKRKEEDVQRKNFGFAMYQSILLSMEGGRKCMKILIDAGANVNELESSHGPPLKFAVLWDSLPAMTVLLDHGADTNLRPHGWSEWYSGDEETATPMEFAVMADAVEAVEMMLDYGADVQIRDEFGQNLLHLAAGAGSSKVAELLLAKGLDMTVKSNKGYTAMDFSKDFKFTRTLLEWDPVTKKRMTSAKRPSTFQLPETARANEKTPSPDAAVPHQNTSDCESRFGIRHSRSFG